MNRTKISFLLSFSIVIFMSFVLFGQDSGQIQKTTIVEPTTTNQSINEDSKTNELYQFLITISPFIIALAGVGISFYSLFNQRIITQKQIDAETKRKFIKDMIEQSKSLSQIIFTLFEITNDFIVSKKKCDIFLEIAENSKEAAIENETLKNEVTSISKNHIYNTENAYDQIFKITKEYYHSVSSIFLYLPRNHEEYEPLKDIAEQLGASFFNYTNCFKLDDVSDGYEIGKEETEKIGDLVTENFSSLREKIQDIIDEERHLLEKIINSRSKKL